MSNPILIIEDDFAVRKFVHAALIEAGYGGWNDEPLDINAKLQVWVARKGA